MNIIGTNVEITRGQVLRYVFLPQIAPRLNSFYQQGFSQLAYLMALVFRAVNILPASHIILRKDNRRTLALRDVIAAATAEIQWTRGNIDKIIIYLLILMGFFLLVGQFFLALAYVMIRPSFAGGMPTTYAEFFDEPNYNYDVAYNLLFAVFGVPELFNDIIGPGIGADPFHTALHSLFQLYSVGLLVIGVIITCYFIFAVLVETAQTGVPFGKRYNHVWTPIRLVVALGLLIPMGYGLNAAQWITLYAAKFGSDFATRGWIIFIDTMSQEFLEDQAERVGQPQTPDITAFVANMSTIMACYQAYNVVGPTYAPPKRVSPYLVRANVYAPPARLLIGATFQNAREFSNNGDIVIRFGQFSPEIHSKMLGSVYPYCGEVVIYAGEAHEPGAVQIQQFYYQLVRRIYLGNYDIDDTMRNFVRRYISLSEMEGGDPNAADIPADFKQTVINAIRADVEEAIENATTAQAASPSWNQNLAEMRERGWGGAGIWFNKIAQINGSLVTAVNSIPEARSMPAVMEYVKKRNLMQNVETAEPYNPNQADNIEMEFESELLEKVGRVLSAVQDYWARETPDQTEEGNQVRRTNNIFIDVINTIFGTRGLFNMCANTDTHPLAQLSILGKGLVEASIRNLMVSAAFSAGAMIPVNFIGSASAAAAGIFTSLAMITITMGFLLFYVVPFMPFLYYFFAVGAWVKGIFEAMVGVPLWALAHLRIDGEGLPGDAAMDGYYLIFEIFLRPILIVFGLLASVVIFSAMVKVLNEIYSLVVYNLSGHDGTVIESCAGLAGGGGGGGGAADAMSFFRGPVDEFFFTVIYAIIVYMIGMSCFKLIDLLPNSILRYMNVSVQTYNDALQDPADGLMIRLSVGMQGASSAVGNISNNMTTASRGIGQFAESQMNPPPPQQQG